jgi:hypothetical protein
VSAARRQVADELIPQLLEDIRDGRGGVRSAVLIHLVNDPSNYVTDRLRAGLEVSGILQLNDLTVTEKLQRMLRLPVSSTADLPAALALARGRGAQAVLFGSVHTFESFASGARLELELSLAELGKGTVVFTRRFTRDTSTPAPALAALQEEVSKLAGPRGLVAWVAAMLLLPVFTVGFIRTMVRRESNRVNALTLGLYTLVDVLLAYLLVGMSLASLTAALPLLGLAALAFAYNVLIMSYAVRLES